MFSRFERLISYRYLRSSRQEGFISVIAFFSFVGIALGVATLIIVMSVMNGFREELLGKILGLNGHISVHALDRPFTDYDAVAQTVRENLPVVQRVIPVVDRQAMVLVRTQARGAMVRGVTQDILEKWPIVAQNIKEGSLDSFGKTGTEDIDGVLMGKRLAAKMGLFVGDRFTLVSPEGNATAFGTMPRQKTFRLAGIFEVGMFQYDEGLIFMPLAAAQSFFKLSGAVSHLDVFIDHPDHVGEQGFLLQTLLGGDFRLFDWQQANNSMFEAVKVERNVMFIILTLIILIAAFNIISSLIMLVKDKNRDIAIMRTMGATQRHIMGAFFLVGSSLGVVGTSLGVLLGVSFTLNIEKIRQFIESLSGASLFKAEIYFLTQLPAKIDWQEVILVVSIALGLSFLATIYPSWRAARLDPVEALRQ